ncbi:MAG: tetratricopeptide repeat protein [Pseudomonadota bacterium]
MIVVTITRIWFMVLAGSFAATAATAPPSSAPCTLLQVQTSPDSVITPCTTIINASTTSPADKGFALFIRGKGYHNTKRLVLAQRDYDEAIKLTPQNAELFVSRANIAARTHRWREATELLQHALTLDPSNAHALRMAGTFTEGADSTRFFTQALASDPAEAYALLFRSRQFRRRGQLDLALKDADALVAIAPEAINRQGYLDERGDRLDFHVIALENRARVHDARGEPQQAERDLEAAITYSPAAQALAARGQYLAYKRGREADALVDLDKAIALGSVDPDTFYAKGVVHVRQREFAKALAAFDAVLTRNAEHGDAWLMRARVPRDGADRPSGRRHAAGDRRRRADPARDAARAPRGRLLDLAGPAEGHDAGTARRHPRLHDRQGLQLMARRRPHLRLAALAAGALLAWPAGAADGIGSAGPIRSYGGTPCPQGFAALMRGECDPPAVDAALPPTQRARAHLDRARQLIGLMRPEQARQAVAEAVAADPTNVAALVLRARTTMEIDSEKARADIATVLAREPDNADALATQAFLISNDPPNALKSVNAALAQAPHHADALWIRSTILTGLGAPDKALRDLDDALATDPDFAQARRSHAELLLRLGAYEKAEADASAMLAQRPDAYAHELRATARTALGNHAGALEDLNVVLVAPAGRGPRPPIGKEQVGLYIQRALALVRTGAPQAARRDLDTVISLGGVRAILQMQLYLRRHGFPDVPLDGKRSDALDDAVITCFVNDACGRGVSIRS